MVRNFRPYQLRIPAARGVLLAGALVLAACAWNEPAAPVADAAAVAKYRAAGYAPDTPAAIEVRQVASVPTQADPWTVTLARPTDHAPRPLLVFLPALGEKDSTPNTWVSTWAGAGYVVLVVQPLAEDAEAWSSTQARQGDFEGVARRRFAADLMPGRLARLAQILQQAQARSLQGEPGLDGIDWTHVGMAGADLGACAIQALAALPPGELSALGLPFVPAAYVAISPVAARTGPENPPTQAQGSLPPVLMASAANDVDAYGVVTDAALRRAAFDRVPAGDAFYLEVESASHRWLAGHAESPPPDAPVRRVLPPPDAPPDSRRKGQGRDPAQAQRRDSMAPENEDPPDPGAAARLQALHLEAARSRARALTRAALSVRSFEAVTTAFWDASLRQSETAHAWLVDSAPRWLVPGDRLKHR